MSLFDRFVPICGSFVSNCVNVDLFLSFVPVCGRFWSILDRFVPVYGCFMSVVVFLQNKHLF